MHYVYLSLYYLSLAIILIAVLAVGILIHWAVFVLICRAFATDANESMSDEKLERVGILTITALLVLVAWSLVNRVVAMLGGINAL